MISVQERIYARLRGDTIDNNGSCLATLLGSIDRIYTGLDWQVAEAPSITFNALTSVPGQINSDSVMVEEEFFVFRIFANNFHAVALRLRMLLNRYTFSETSEAGVLKCVWDSDGPEIFDDELKVRRRDSRFKIYAMPEAVGPI